MDNSSKEVYDSVRDWLDNASDLNAPDEGGLFLIRAIINSDDPLFLKEAIRKNINVNQDTGNGWTALHEAVAVAIDEMIQNDRQKPYPWSIEMIKILLENGSDLNKTDAEGKTPLDCLNIYSADINDFNHLKDIFRTVIPDIDTAIHFVKNVGYSK